MRCYGFVEQWAATAITSVVPHERAELPKALIIASTMLLSLCVAFSQSFHPFYSFTRKFHSFVFAFSRRVCLPLRCSVSLLQLLQLFVLPLYMLSHICCPFCAIHTVNFFCLFFVVLWCFFFVLSACACGTNSLREVWTKCWHRRQCGNMALFHLILKCCEVLGWVALESFFFVVGLTKVSWPRRR